MKINRKNKILFSVLFIVILIFVLSIIRVYSESNGENIKDIVYATTSYTKDTTLFFNSKDDSVEKYSLMNVDAIYQLTKGKIIADKYGNDAFLLQDGKHEKEIEFNYYNIYDIKEYNGYVYVLFSYSANKSKIVKYDLSFNTIEESSDLTGVPRNIVIQNDMIFLVANDYTSENRKIKLRSLSLTLEVINEIEISDLCFAFMIDCIEGNIIVYGNEDEENQMFAFSIFNENLLEISNRSYDIYAQWVRKSMKYNDYYLILNDLSIIKINSAYDWIGTYEKNDYLIVDAVVDDDLLYVLSSQTGKEITLDVLKIDDFSVIYTKSYTNGLEYDYMVPSCIVELN